MHIHLNGQSQECLDGVTVAELLSRLGLGAHRVAVELNLDILPKKHYGATVLKEGDRIEIVHVVGGGVV